MPPSMGQSIRLGRAIRVSRRVLLAAWILVSVLVSVGFSLPCVAMRETAPERLAQAAWILTVLDWVRYRA
jgi:hypothetical protein